MVLIRSTTLEEIIYARLDAGGDLLRSIEEICRQRDIRTGLILTLTGSLVKARLQRFPQRMYHWVSQLGWTFVYLMASLTLAGQFGSEP